MILGEGHKHGLHLDNCTQSTKSRLKLRSATCSGGLSTTHLVSEVPLAAVGRTRSRRGRQRRLAASRGA